MQYNTHKKFYISVSHTDTSNLAHAIQCIKQFDDVWTQWPEERELI